MAEKIICPLKRVAVLLLYYFRCFVSLKSHSFIGLLGNLRGELVKKNVSGGCCDGFKVNFHDEGPEG